MSCYFPSSLFRGSPVFFSFFWLCCQDLREKKTRRMEKKLLSPPSFLSSFLSSFLFSFLFLSLFFSSCFYCRKISREKNYCLLHLDHFGSVITLHDGKITNSENEVLFFFFFFLLSSLFLLLLLLLLPSFSSFFFSFFPFLLFLLLWVCYHAS